MYIIKKVIQEGGGFPSEDVHKSNTNGGVRGVVV